MKEDSERKLVSEATEKNGGMEKGRRESCGGRRARPTRVASKLRYTAGGGDEINSYLGEPAG